MLRQIILLTLVTCAAWAAEPYPVVQPYNKGYLQVSELHRIYFEEYGKPDGVPVLVVHGGPCGGCPPSFSRFFDPDFYHVIMFDQRGCMRSTPAGEMKENNTQALIADMEQLREHVGVDKWWLFGGSWGSTLSVAYGEAQPEHCLGFVLRGVFIADDWAIDNLVYGMQQSFPDAYEEWQNHFPQEERSDLLAACYKRLMDPDPAVHLPVAHAFMKYDTLCATLRPTPALIEEEAKNHAASLQIARAFFHYAVNKFFLQDNELLGNVSKIQHLPCTIVHGRYDIICPAIGAYKLHKLWPGSKLNFVADAGHASCDPALSAALVDAMDEIKELSLAGS